MAESYQEKLKRVRPPRVRIDYTVETEGAEPVLELPFVVGVLADLSGMPSDPLKPLKQRTFASIEAWCSGGACSTRRSRRRFASTRCARSWVAVQSRNRIRNERALSLSHPGSYQLHQSPRHNELLNSR